MFDSNTSLFGYQCDDAAYRNSYDMMVLQELGLLDSYKNEAGENEEEG